MRARIHRGTREIGGTAIELEHDGARLLLDLGLPLDGDPDDLDVHPAIDGLAGGGDLLALVLSHGHLDHVGLAHLAGPELPVALGAATHRILRAAAPFVPRPYLPKRAVEFASGMPLTFGPFTVTPYLVDHSAYDAYALVVEAGAECLVYSGDLRGHGRKGALLERLVRVAPRGADALLLEGSCLGRLDPDQTFPTENEIEARFVALFREAPGMALIAASAQNIDRMVSLYRAAKRTGRTLVIDLYAAEVLRATGNPNIPQSDWPNVAVHVPQYQRVQIKRSGRFDLIERYRTNRIFPEALAALAPRAALLFRPAMLRDLDRAGSSPARGRCGRSGKAISESRAGRRSRPSSRRATFRSTMPTPRATPACPTSSASPPRSLRAGSSRSTPSTLSASRRCSDPASTSSRTAPGGALPHDHRPPSPAADAFLPEAAPAYRGLSVPFLAALEALATEPHGAWWRDVLSHPDLILAVRREALDVYYRGASLFRVRFVQGAVTADTHAKYLVRQGQARVGLDPTGDFKLADKSLVWSSYAGLRTLSEMIKAAGALVGAEKTGVHALVKASPNVVDVEIALAGNDPGDPAAGTDAEPGTAEGGPRQDRIDVASLEERGDTGEAWLVFHEAKDYTNPSLRAAAKRQPGIVAQIGRYRGSLGQNAGGLGYSYPFVCRALARLDALRRSVRATDPAWAGRAQPPLDLLITAVADGTRRLRVDTEPRLVVFGFDADQRDGAWAAERARLKDAFGLRVYAVGDPTAAKVASAFRRPADVPLSPPPSSQAPPPERIPLPDGAPPGLSLYFGAGPMSARPVYLLNPGDGALHDVRVASVGVTSNHPSVVHTATATHAIDECPAGVGLLIDQYDVMTDGDMLTPYTITALRADGRALVARTIIDKGGPKNLIVPLDVSFADAPPSPAPTPAATP